MHDERTVESILKQFLESVQDELREKISALLLLQLSGKEAGNWLIRIRDGILSLEAGRADAPDLTLSLDSDLFRGLLAGTVKPLKAFMNGTLQVSGDLPLAMTLAGAFRPV